MNFYYSLLLIMVLLCYVFSCELENQDILYAWFKLSKCNLRQARFPSQNWSAPKYIKM